MRRSSFSAILVTGSVFLTLLSASLFAVEGAYDSGKRRDPFVPLQGDDLASAASVSAGVKLEGIIYDPSDQSMAILNGKTYQAGDIVGDATVLRIKKDHVVISVGGEEKTLWMRDELAPEE